METTVARFFPHLRPAHQRTLALWVWGTILAQSACQSAVVVALSVYGPAHAIRQRLREWLYDGADKAAPCQTQLVVQACFAPLLRWVLTWWQEHQLALALDATLDRDRHAALVISVLYRGNALPVAWAIRPANTRGAWLPHIRPLLRLLGRAVPRQMPVLVLIDRGLWSPVLWRRIRRLGWHPMLRIRSTTIFTPTGQPRRQAARLVPGPGHAWVGTGRLGQEKSRRHLGTLLVVWDAASAEPWVVLTDLAPQQVGLGWYGLRMWIEVGFRALKGVGWQWERTRRTDVERVARHWLVLAVAMLWVLAYGTRVADAAQVGRAPQDVRAPVGPPCGTRRVSVFTLGLRWLQHHLHQGRLWQRLWLWPDPWPAPPPNLQLMFAW